MKKNNKTFKPKILVCLIQISLMVGINNSLAQRSYSIPVPDETKERLNDIYEEGEFNASYFRGDWLPDGSGFLVIENTSGNVPSLVRYDVNSGNRTIMVSSDQLESEKYNSTFDLTGYTLSSDGSKILLTTECKDKNECDRAYFIFETESGSLQEVSAGYNNSISPDGQKILYSENNNLYVYDLSNDDTVALTDEEEDGPVSNNRATWSPDGKSIVYVQSDASDVRLRASLEPGDPSYPEVKEVRFARVDGHISVLRVGVVDADGKEKRWLPVPIPNEGYYLGPMSWVGNSNRIMIEKRSRFRDQREFMIADIESGEIKSVYEESDPAWVIASYRINAGVDWVNDYNNFILLSEKDGWRHAYLYSLEGKNEELLTPGAFDIIERAGIAHDKGYFYYHASPENGTQKYLYRVNLKGKKQPERVTPEQPGTHDYDLSPDAKWAFHTYSSANTPPVTELISLPDHKVIRVLEDNKELTEKVKGSNFQPKEFIKIDIGDGIVMDAWMIKPENFKPSEKYPVFVYVYGEPHAQTVKDSWGHAMTEYHRTVADLGYIVVSIDNRGTPCPKGAAWRRAIAGSLGPLSTEEQAAALQEMAKTRSYIDLSRVGIWGWSGGGSNTLNAMFRKPDVYNLGIAVAPKPQPHLYNAWFQEIYMKTPTVNPEGYEKSAPINYAEGLEGNLLIVHGSGETNTHVQITEGLVDKLIALGKQFDYMNYPNRDHGIREGEGTSLHLRVHMIRYLLNHLPAGPK